MAGLLGGWCRETLHKEMRVVDKFRNKGEEERVLQKFSDIEAKKPHTFLYDIGRSKVRRDGGGAGGDTPSVRSQEEVSAATGPGCVPLPILTCPAAPCR